MLHIQYKSMKKLNALVFTLISTLTSFGQFWNPLEGPTGFATITSLITNDGTIFVLSGNLEIYRSIDNGNQWTNVSSGIPQSSLFCPEYSYKFTQSPLDSAVYIKLNCSLLKFDKRKLIWTLINPDFDFLDYGFNYNGTIIFAGNSKNLYYSKDGGINMIQSISISTHTLKIYQFGQNTNYFRVTAGTCFEYYKFNDDFSGLINIYPNCGSSNFTYLKKSNEVVILINNKLQYSKDNGKNWRYKESVINGEALDDITENVFGDLIGIGQEHYFKYDVINNSWINLGRFKEPYFISNSNLSFSFSKDNSFLLSGSGFITLIDEEFKQFSLNIPIKKSIYSNLKVFEKNTIVCRTEQATLFSNNDGLTWKKLPGNIISDHLQLMENGVLLYLPSIDTLYFSFDEGETWSKKRAPAYFENLLITKQNELIYFLNNKRYYSNDLGDSWAVDTILGLNTDEISYFAIRHNEIIYLVHQDNFYFSSDKGLHWQIEPLNITTNLFNRIINYKYTNTGYYYFAIGENEFKINYILYTKNLGTKYDTIILSQSAYLDLQNNDSYIYLRNNSENSINIFNLESKTSMSIPLRKTTNDPIFYPRNIALRENGYLYCSVQNDVIYKSISNVLTSLQKEKKSQLEFYPIRVAPNPISDISQIYLPESISKDSKLIEIYSLQAGVLEKFWTNENTIQVNKKDKKPGMYFLKITTNSNQTFSTKFLIQ